MRGAMGRFGLARAAWLVGGLCVAGLLGGCVARPPAPVAQDAASALGPYAAAAPFYEALDRASRGAARSPVLLLQIGDSHTANDAFSGHLRELLQARFGDAGRGLLPPGVPYRYYHPARVTVQSDGFRVVSAYHAGSRGPFGITGLRQHAAGRAEMRLITDTPGDAAIGWIEVLAQPGGGHLVVSADTGGSSDISTAGEGGPIFVRLPSTAATQRITVQARGDGPVDLLSWDVRRDAPGVLVDNLGTIGATIDLLGRFDPDIVRTELQHLQPALLLVAFGTNEGFNDTLDIDGYRQRYE